MVAAYREVEISLECIKFEVEDTEEALDVRLWKVIVGDADGEFTDELGIVSDDPIKDETGFGMRKGVGKIELPETGMLVEVVNDNINVDDDEMNISVEDGVILGVVGVDGDVSIVIDVKDVSQESEVSEVIVGGGFEDIDDGDVKMVVSGVADSEMVDVGLQIQPDEEVVARNSGDGENVYDGPQ